MSDVQFSVGSWKRRWFCMGAKICTMGSTNNPPMNQWKVKKRSNAMIARPEGSLHTVGKAVGKADEMAEREEDISNYDPFLLKDMW